MGRDRTDGDLALRRAVTPEHPVGAGRVVLGIGLKDFLAWPQGIAQRSEFVGVKPRVPGTLGSELVDAALHLLEEAEWLGHPAQAHSLLCRGVQGGAQLATRNVADFVDLGLELINPWNTP
jgi:hypothetical protein